MEVVNAGSISFAGISTHSSWLREHEAPRWQPRPPDAGQPRGQAVPVSLWLRVKISIEDLFEM